MDAADAEGGDNARWQPLVPPRRLHASFVRLGRGKPSDDSVLMQLIGQRPDIRVNQLGYLPDTPKHAVWVTEDAEPAPFAVHAQDGSAVLRGWSRPWARRP